MNVFEGLPTHHSFTKAVVTVGMYDGVHLAHKLILQRVCNLAKAIGGESVLVTFDPHPRAILYPEEKIAMLTTREEKIALLDAIGVDHIIFIPFSLQFSKMSSSEFVKSIIVDTIHAQKIVVGYNHYFGHNREGNLVSLTALGLQYGFDVEEIPEQDIQNESISSSKIRKALAEGDMMRANAYLDYEYHFSAHLNKGDTLFSSMGYSGWNVEIDEHKLIPTEGLYFVNIEIDKTLHHGALWINCDSGTKASIQVLIVDYHSETIEIKATIIFKRLVRMCNSNLSSESIKKTIAALIFQTTL